jgi:hypothetical protein
MHAWLKAVREIVADWLLGDFAYAVLPIVFIFVVRAVYPSFTANVWRMPEWSFASVIFYGVSLRHHIQHNLRYKKANRSALDWGAQIYSLLLILSAVTLALAMVTENEKDANHRFVEAAQQVFFFGGVLSLFLDSFVAWWNRRQHEDLRKRLSTADALEYARWDANGAVRGTRSALLVLQHRLDQIRITSVEDDERFYALSFTIDMLRTSVDDLNECFARMRADATSTIMSGRETTPQTLSGGNLTVRASDHRPTPTPLV